MYRLTTNGVQRLTDGAWIPADPKNRDWREYQKWLSAGNIPEPDSPSPIKGLDKLTELEARIAALETK